MIQISENVSLAAYSTMRLGGKVAYLTEIHTRDDMKQAFDWAIEHQQQVIMIGGGSNIVWQDEGFQGLVIVNRILGYEDLVSADSHFITVGAGEIWDSVVARTVAAGLTGIEALSLIPGTAGATPVQNVGAYGQEIAQTLTTVEVYDVAKGAFMNLRAEDCGFGYRSSKFQSEFRGQYFISAITLHLVAGNPFPPYYGAVEKYLSEHPIEGPVTPRVIRDAVIDIRSHKLPDPAEVANCGSFFGNPVVDRDTLNRLLEIDAEMPHWPNEQGAKVPAAWLIEQVGYKDVHDSRTGMATWHAQPLVLVNEHAKATSDLIAFRDEIMTAVQNKFGVTLRQEPELLP